MRRWLNAVVSWVTRVAQPGRGLGAAGSWCHRTCDRLPGQDSAYCSWTLKMCFEKCVWGVEAPASLFKRAGLTRPQSLLSSGAQWRQLIQPRPREAAPLQAVLCPGAGQRLASVECFPPKAPGQIRTLPGGQGVFQPQGLTFMCPEATRPEATRPASMLGEAVTLCERGHRVGLSCAHIPPGLLVALTVLDCVLPLPLWSCPESPGGPGGM